jgi:hypothetical protein
MTFKVGSQKESLERLRPLLANIFYIAPPFLEVRAFS